MTNTTYVRFVRDGEGRQPQQAFHDDAGWDLAIAEMVSLAPGESRDIRTGVWAAFPDGFWGMIMSRSSIMRKFKVHIAPAVIDAGFRGELMVLVTNLNQDETVNFHPGDRLAQVILVPVPRVEWIEQATLPPGTRGDRGFGSSGLSDYRHVGSQPEPNVNAHLALAAVAACDLLTEEQLRMISVPAEPEEIRDTMIRAFHQLRGL